MSIHIVYAPVASATNVRNINTNKIQSPGQYAATGNVPQSVIEDPDDKFGSSSVATANEGQPIALSANAVHGRYDKFTVVNNPA